MENAAGNDSIWVVRTVVMMMVMVLLSLHIIAICCCRSALLSPFFEAGPAGVCQPGPGQEGCGVKGFACCEAGQGSQEWLLISQSWGFRVFSGLAPGIQGDVPLTTFTRYLQEVDDLERQGTSNLRFYWGLVQALLHGKGGCLLLLMWL